MAASGRGNAAGSKALVAGAAFLCMAAVLLVATPAAEAGATTYLVGDDVPCRRRRRVDAQRRLRRVAGRQDLPRRRRARVQVQQHVPRRGVGEQGWVQEVHRVAQGVRPGVPQRLRRGDAAQGHALLHLRRAGPLQRRHEARRHRVLMIPSSSTSGVHRVALTLKSLIVLRPASVCNLCVLALGFVSLAYASRGMSKPDVFSRSTPMLKLLRVSLSSFKFLKILSSFKR
uniref:Uncharacterized protein n=1 Tax=Triticum urartu TaxID=4572 RepID=A0A8R7U672_TRIUA